MDNEISNILDSIKENKKLITASNSGKNIIETLKNYYDEAFRKIFLMDLETETRNKFIKPILTKKTILPYNESDDNGKYRLNSYIAILDIFKLELNISSAKKYIFENIDTNIFTVGKTLNIFIEEFLKPEIYDIFTVASFSDLRDNEKEECEKLYKIDIDIIDYNIIVTLQYINQCDSYISIGHHTY